ncbi:hypothetical protein AB0I81_40055 [Nonomuraea sp. NPDC050404]|uniref:hypothetical protein n=1 Tax=Nonomuraea sp. NPDC050404 TaxID=3155783 RepID=UPI0033C82E7D
MASKRKLPETPLTISEQKWADLRRRAAKSPESPFSPRALARREAVKDQQQKRHQS